MLRRIVKQCLGYMMEHGKGEGRRVIPVQCSAVSICIVMYTKVERERKYISVQDVCKKKICSWNGLKK